MPWQDPVKVAEHTEVLKAKMPRLEGLLLSLNRCVCEGGWGVSSLSHFAFAPAANPALFPTPLFIFVQNN